MDVLLLQYRLAQLGVDNTALREAMSWSDGTRITRVNTGKNWTADELRTLLRLGLTFEDLKRIFFRGV